MLIYFLIIFLNFIIIISRELEQCQSNFIFSYLNSNYEHYCKDLEKELKNMDTEKNKYLISIVVLITRSDLEQLIIQFRPSINKFLNENLGNDENLNKTNQIIQDLLNDDEKFNEFINLIEDNKDDICKEILKNISSMNVIDLACIIVNNENIFNKTRDFIKKNPDIVNILYLIPKYFNFEQDETEAFDTLVDFYKKYIDIIDIFPDIAKDIYNMTNVFYCFKEYVFNNKSEFIIDLLRLATSKEMTTVVKRVFSYSRTILGFCDFVDKHFNDTQEMIDILSDNPEAVQDFIDVLFDLYHKEALVRNVFYKDNLMAHQKLISKIYIFGLFFAKDNDQMEGFVDLLVILLKTVFTLYSERRSYTYTEDCHYLLQYAFLGNDYLKINETLAHNISNFFVYKALMDTTKTTNDLLSFDDCLKKPPMINYISLNELENIGIVPSYVIGTLDRTGGKRKHELKKSTKIEDNYLVVSLCLPQAYKNKIKYNDSYLYCNNDDYSILLKNMLSYITDTENATISVVSIRKGESLTDKLSIWTIFFGRLIPLYIILIPFFCGLIILVFKKKIEKKNKINFNESRDSINDIKDNSKEDKEERKDESQDSEEIHIEENPKWLLFLDQLFNFRDNTKELFNFELKITKINNVKGLNYIGGLMGISIILTILGQVYLILYNLPNKEFGLSNFYNLLNSFQYFYFFYGLRYSPRILFSCSGYTLPYKYLSYLDKDANNNIIKFIFRHFYKYLILILFIIFSRYTLYILISFVDGVGPDSELFNKTVLMVPEGIGNFILCLLGFKTFIVNKIDSRSTHYLIDYFWMPYNEIVFFLFGTTFLTLGKNYKLRIDYYILIIIAFLYFFKIIGYFVYYYSENKIYTTLYYYLFDYGEVMTSPIFNLSYYLIGMYFGLINYNLEKGIIELYKDSSYEKIMNDEKKESGKNNETIQLHEINKNENNSLNDEKEEEEKMIDSDEKFLKKKESLINKNDKKDINNEQNTNQSNKEYVKELKEMPFLISGVKMRDSHIKTKIYVFYIILSIICIIIILFGCVHRLVLNYYKDKLNDSEELVELEKNLRKLSLESVITNKFLNFIYLIDIEIVIFLVHWGFFILLIKQQYIIEFFNHIYWSFFYKFYFAFLIISDICILHILYESETVVKLNLLTLVFFFFISIIVIFIITYLCYVALDLPLKKLFKYFFTDNYNIFSISNDNKEIDDEKKEDIIFEID